MRSQEEGTQMGALRHTQRGSCCDDGFQSQDGDRRGKSNLPPTVADRGVPARLDQRAMCTPAISMPRTRKDIDGSYLGLPQLQHHSVGQHTTQAQCRSLCCSLADTDDPLRPTSSREQARRSSVSRPKSSIRTPTCPSMLMMKIRPVLDPILF